MPQFIVTMKGIAEVTGSVRVEAENEFEAHVKARKKVETDSVSWTNAQVKDNNVRTERVFKYG
jgi:hypothetical protein